MSVSLSAFALDPQGDAVHGLVAIPLSVPSTDAPVEERTLGQRLRDALRQPLAETDPDSKPYRLTPEERQRLRSQLREQIEQTAHDNHAK